MHSCCLISGISQGNRSPRGPNEYDKHPAFKLRKATQAYEKRLAIEVATLDQRCQEITSKITHRMKMASLALKRIQNNDKSRHSFEKQDKHIRKRPPLSKDVKVADDLSKSNQSNKKLSRTEKMQNNRNGRVSKHTFELTKICNDKDGIGDKRKRFQHKPCHFGTTKGDTKCFHFPCHQPDTYHSLGFRLDDSSTNQWMTWSEFKKSKINIPSENTASNTRARHARESNSSLSRWCSLPMDFESRKQRLHDEIEQRRIQNMAYRPKCWETNYGKMTPYKVLAYPVRLNPLQMTTH